MDCVEVCPVDCFYEGETMLVIHPDECIDCGVCEPECPVDAIKPDTEPGLEKWLEINAQYARVWQNITINESRHQMLRTGRAKIGLFLRSRRAKLVELAPRAHIFSIGPRPGR